jgi:hypothetical protein
MAGHRSPLKRRAPAEATPPHRRPADAHGRFGGSEPCSYALDPALNWLPESLPIDFPFGDTGLCFAERAGWFEERVVLPNGIGFSLT